MRNPTEAQWSDRTYLQDPLILLCLVLVNLLDRLHVLLQVGDCMFPCVQALSEETGGLYEGIVRVHPFLQKYF